MRLSARDIDARVTATPDTARPIRLRAAGLVFALDTTEALSLAHQLADAVDEIRKHERNTAP